MVELSHWREVVVFQRNPTGCIPTGFEWLIRYAKISDVDLGSFQEDFDLQRSGIGMNDFGSVTAKIKEMYPRLNIVTRTFANGKEKLQFVESLIGKDTPCLLSIANTPMGGTWHIVPVVIMDNEKLRVLWNGNQIQEFTLEDIAIRHNTWIGGKDIAWVEKTATVPS